MKFLHYIASDLVVITKWADPAPILLTNPLSIQWQKVALLPNSSNHDHKKKILDTDAIFRPLHAL